MGKEPLVSIITACYNGEKNLRETIESIISQTYKNLEYIIIDGGSTDKTIEIIKSYEAEAKAKGIAYKWISEADSGISDAFNKGVKLSKGKYINFQGDGDGFYSEDALEKLFENIDEEKDIFVCGRIQRVDIYNNEIFRSKCIKKFNKKSLLFKMSLPHQGLFTHRNYFEEYGLFDVNNTFCMDYDHLLRSYHKFPKVVTKNILVAKWRDDGLGNGRTLEIFKEYDRIKRNNKVLNSFSLDLIKYWILLKYKIKKGLKNEN